LAAKGGFQRGQTAKAREDHRVQSLPFLGPSHQPGTNLCNSQDRLFRQNLNPAKAVGIVLIPASDERFVKSTQETR
jgi:hypothetical protein